jgi:hypothetical protein
VANPARGSSYTAGVIRFPALLAAAVLLASAGCRQFTYSPESATRPYPTHLAQGEVARIQAFSDGVVLEVVNASGTSYREFDLWVNRRWMRFVPQLDAGETLVLPLGEFWDSLGEAPQTGGFFAAYKPTPVVLVQLQIAEDAPLVGTIAVPLGSDRP